MTDAIGSADGGQPGAAGAGSPAWFQADGMAAEQVTQFGEVVKTKGWKHPAEAVQSYINLEKVFGADKAGRTILAPKGDDDAEGWNAVYGKLGRPDTAEGYQLPLPEGDTGEFAKTVAPVLHKLGLSQKQAAGLAEWWNGYGAQSTQAADEAYELQSGLDVQSLQKEWGGDFAKNQELGRRAIRESGLTAEQAIAIERAIGVSAAAKAFAMLGQQFAEAPMHQDGGGSPSISTAEGAKAKIASLMADRDFTARYLSGDPEAAKQMTNLHALAYTEQKS